MGYIKIKKAIYSFLFSVMIIAPGTSQTSIDSLINAMPETCKSLMDQRGWPSLSISLVHDQEIIYSQAFGLADIDKNVPATTKTIYRVGSITKLFTATMLMQMAEKGIVNLNDPLIKHIPAYKPTYPINTGPTTLHQLATHTSGLNVDANQGFWHYLSNLMWIVSRGKEQIVWGVTKNDLLTTLDQVEIRYVPNTKPHYSNFGYQLLGMALERTAKVNFEKYVKSKILNPLKMNDSGFNLNEEQRSRFAVGYTYLEPNFERFVSPDWELDVLKYSGGLYSTSEDIARFISLQFRDQIDGRKQIISGDGLRCMRTPQTMQGKDTYGIGWGIYYKDGYQVITHAGGHWGFFAKAEVIPELKFGVVIMTNCNYPQGYIGPEKRLTKIIYEKFIPVLKEEKAKEPDKQNKHDLNRYVGQYAVAGRSASANIYPKNKKLFLRFKERPSFNYEIKPVKLNEFCFAIDPKKNVMLRFKNDGHENVINFEFLSFIFKKEN
ncbi:MAG: serine hydrolase [Calditrichaeota bacterium]|nr:serine hydrolase [Calditrichota bacterium]